MTNASSTQAEAAIAALMESDESQLYEELGIRSKAIGRQPEIAGSFNPALSFDQAAMGSLDEVRKLGQRIYRRWHREAYALCCGDSPDDKKDRQTISGAFGLGAAAVAASLATALVGTFGLAPAIAAVIAALVIKRVFRPAYQEFCLAWKEQLPPV
jgi:hypothetical protein